jgi:glycosyltransferase involved in cell wall biosynthesis
MRVFMLGWEFPPFISGGLGTACYGLTKALDECGVEVCFVLPTAVPTAPAGPDAPPPSAESAREPYSADGMEGLAETSSTQTPPYEELCGTDVDDMLDHHFEHLSVHQLGAVLQPYATPEQAREQVEFVRRYLRRRARRQAEGKPAATPACPSAAVGAKGDTRRQTPRSASSPPPGSLGFPRGSRVLGGAGVHYDGDLMSEVNYFADLSRELSRQVDFDLVHAHDWMTYKAGVAVARESGRPLIVHLHSSEFDRSGEHVNQAVYDIEREGLHAATKIICVSYLTRNIAIRRYGVPAEKIEVVYNAVELPAEQIELEPIRRNEKIVLFLGRVTFQKGPEYFLRAAKKVVEKYKNVRFVVAGSGDMIPKCIQLAADLRIGRYVTFTGFLRGNHVRRIFEMADLYVMPSVSEPFGIAPLEAMSHNVPVIISRQSGVSEVLRHVLKVDFWNVDEMADKILAVLRHEPLQKTLRQQGAFELKKFSWLDSARQVKQIYQRTLAGARG